MERRISKNNVEERLLETRKNGLLKAAKSESMCAHGKVLGMDTFSWVEPQVDKLATVIHSFPFKVIWIGSNEHIERCFESYPELIDSVELVIIYDQAAPNLHLEPFNRNNNFVCTEGTAAALELAKSLQTKKRVFLFTINKVTAKEEKHKFEQFISLFS